MVDGKFYDIKFLYLEGVLEISLGMIETSFFMIFFAKKYLLGIFLIDDSLTPFPPSLQKIPISKNKFYRRFRWF